MSSAASGVIKGFRALLAPVKASSGTSSATKSTAKPKLVRPPSGILKKSPVSPALRQFLAVPEVSRADAIKKIWDYIKLHNLQNPTNKREILCDAKLKTIFEGKDKVGFLEIGKLLSRHFVKTG